MRLAGLILLLLVIVGIAFVPRLFPGSEAPSDSDYPQLAQRAGLQVEVEHLDAEVDWRERARVGQTDRTGNANWLAGLPVGLIARLVYWFLLIAAIGVVVYVILLLIRNLNTGRLGGQRKPQPGARRVVGETIASSAPQPLLSVEAILAMDDLVAAIGELQRSALDAAARLTGLMLRRSETARDVLRRLPDGWSYLPVLFELVREAETVRYAGAEVERERLAELADAVRPMLSDAEGAR